MSSSVTYPSWTPAPYTLGVYIGDRWYRGGGLTPPHDLSLSPGGSVLPTLGHSDIVQFRTLGGQVPANVQPVSFSLQARFRDEEDLRAIEEGCMSGRPVDFWMDQPFAEIWHIPSQVAGQTLWKTARQLPYGLTGVTHVTRPPKALIDGVEQTVVTAPGPAAGEVYVPEEQDYSEIETPSGISGTFLTLRYPPIFRVRLTVTRQLAEWNVLVANLTIEEVRSRRFT